MKKEKQFTHSPKIGIDYIGITCITFCHDGQGKILLQKRSNRCRDEHGRWDPGGGSLEFGESFEEGVQREVMEEYGATADRVSFVDFHNVLRMQNGVPTHWIALVFLVKVNPQEVVINEPHMVDDYGWFELNHWPKPLHSQFLIDSAKITQELLQNAN